MVLKILGKYQKVISQWPRMLSLIFLFGRFIYILVKAIRIRLHMEQEVRNTNTWIVMIPTKYVYNITSLLPSRILCCW